MMNGGLSGNDWACADTHETAGAVRCGSAAGCLRSRAGADPHLQFRLESCWRVGARDGSEWAAGQRPPVQRFHRSRGRAASPLSACSLERVPLSLAVALDASLSMAGDRFRLDGEAVRILGGQTRPGDQLAIDGVQRPAISGRAIDIGRRLGGHRISGGDSQGQHGVLRRRRDGIRCRGERGEFVRGGSGYFGWQ